MQNINFGVHEFRVVVIKYWEDFATSNLEGAPSHTYEEFQLLLAHALWRSLTFDRTELELMDSDGSSLSLSTLVKFINLIKEVREKAARAGFKASKVESYKGEYGFALGAEGHFWFGLWPDFSKISHTIICFGVDQDKQRFRTSTRRSMEWMLSKADGPPAVRIHLASARAGRREGSGRSPTAPKLISRILRESTKSILKPMGTLRHRHQRTLHHPRHVLSTSSAAPWTPATRPTSSSSLAASADMPFGGTTSADDYLTGTRAAAIGGTTTVIDFALQSHGHTLADALETWNKKADGKACIDYSLHMAITDLNPSGGTANETLAEMDDMVRAGIPSFKLFMAYPNVLMIDDGLMFRVMQKAAALKALCLIHAENGSAIDVIVAQALAQGHTEPRYHALTRSTQAEAEATHRAIALAEMAGAAVYIVHLSNSDALRELKAAQQRGLKALAETCTQYLLLSLEDQMPGKSFEEAKYVFTPPLRSKSNHAPLWQALADGSLSVVSTDHCPFRFSDQKSLGKDDFTKIPNGGPGIENRMQLLWHHGVDTGLLTPHQFVALTSTNPAHIFGMSKKGVIAPGYDADILLWDPNADYTISAATQAMNTDYSMFEGWKVKGNAAKVFSRGKLVVDAGKFLGTPGHGRFLKREANAGGLA